jgi:hypothetical protein
LNWHFDDALR